MFLKKTAKNILKTSFENGVNFLILLMSMVMAEVKSLLESLLIQRSERIYVATKAGRRINPHEASRLL